MGGWIDDVWMDWMDEFCSLSSYNIDIGTYTHACFHIGFLAFPSDPMLLPMPPHDINSSTSGRRHIPSHLALVINLVLACLPACYSDKQIFHHIHIFPLLPKKKNKTRLKRYLVR